MPDTPPPSETAYTLLQPGRILDAIERCMADRLTPHRSGWSTAHHLSRDLERLYGLHAPMATVARALRELDRRKLVQLKAGDDHILWYRLRDH